MKTPKARLYRWAAAIIGDAMTCGAWILTFQLRGRQLKLTPMAEQGYRKKTVNFSVPTNRLNAWTGVGGTIRWAKCSVGRKHLVGGSSSF